MKNKSQLFDIISKLKQLECEGHLNLPVKGQGQTENWVMKYVAKPAIYPFARSFTLSKPFKRYLQA